MNPLLLSSMTISFAPALVLICQLALLALNGVLLVRVIRRKGAQLFSSVAFMFIVAFTAIYQIPSVLYGGHILSNMPEPLWFLVVVNLVPLILGVWLSFEFPAAFGDNRTLESNNGLYGVSRSEGRSFALLSLMAFCCIGFYLYFIPWHCTGLWAMLNDPEAVLLARELTMKLNGAPFVNRIYGFYINVVAPLFCFIGFFILLKLIRLRYYIRSIALIVFLLVFFPTLYVAGIKGSLVNAAIFCVIAFLSIPQNIRTKATVGFFSMVAFVGMVLLVEMARERINSGDSVKYDFAMCVKSFGACERASVLIKSAGMRQEGSLGLKPDRIQEYANELKKNCPAENDGLLIRPIKGNSILDKTTRFRFNSDEYKSPVQLSIINSALAAENGMLANTSSRNMLLNGDFRFWQCENETYNGGIYRYGCAKMWRYYAKGLRSGEAIYSRGTVGSGIPGMPRGVNYLRWTQTKPTEIGVSAALSQQIPNVSTFEGKSVTLSFYARASSDRVISIQLIQSFNDGTKLAQGFSDVTVSRRWHRFERTLALPLLPDDKAKDGGYLDLVFTEYSGKTFTLDLARVQLEDGNGATPFHLIPFDLERLKIETAEENLLLALPQPRLLLALPQPRPRILQLLESLLDRFFRVPFQVSTWHFMNAVDDTTVVWSAIPFLNRLQADNRNISEEVYQKFGSFYSSGDVTSTSTAPTTFVFQYSAYLGWFGFILALSLIIALDFICSVYYRHLTPVLAYGFAGYVATLVFNMISSDFFTVLFSHGAFLGIFTFYLLNRFGAKKGSDVTF